MLEQPRKVGTRVVSHMLTSHGGELFIHVLATSRCTLQDPPSISKGCGGRLTDYRIKVKIGLKPAGSFIIGLKEYRIKRNILGCGGFV